MDVMRLYEYEDSDESVSKAITSVRTDVGKGKLNYTKAFTVFITFMFMTRRNPLRYVVLEAGGKQYSPVRECRLASDQ